MFVPAPTTRVSIQDVPVHTRVLIAMTALAVSFSAGCRKTPAAEPTASAQTPAAADQPSAPPKPMPAVLPDVLARVNGEAVTKVDFERLLKNIELRRGAIPAEKRDEILRAALDQLITYHVMKQEAAARKVPIADTDLDSRVKQMQGALTAEQFSKALSDRNTSAEQLRTDARIDMMIDKMMEGELATTTPATEAEAKEFYDKNPDKFKQGEAVRASHILVMANEQADEATKKKARTKIDDILKRVRAGEDFAKLAKEHSDDGSKDQGGDLGFFVREKMVPPFSEAAFALKPGEVSDVVTTQFGYHIIKLAERKEATTIPYEKVQPQIVQFLSEQKKRDRVNAVIEEVKKRAKIEVLV
jgi:peptidyl-prolyl cis-trans isomerase C